MPSRVYGAKFKNGPRGVKLTMKSGGAITFGKIVKQDSTADQCIVNAAAGSAILGIALDDAKAETDNGSEAYASGDIVQMETMVPGQVYYGYANGAIALADFVRPSTAGDIAAEAVATTRTVNTLGVALEAISDDAWGEFLYAPNG